MTQDFLAAVIDTILPGEASAPGSALPLPSGTRAGLVRHADDRRRRAVLRLIAEVGGGESAFVSAPPARRGEILAAVETASFDAFRALVTALLQDYYESPAVLSALGWRIEPPQPQGHSVQQADEATLRLLDKVRGRGPIWRDPGRSDR